MHETTNMKDILQQNIPDSCLEVVIHRLKLHDNLDRLGTYTMAKPVHLLLLIQNCLKNLTSFS